MSVAVAGFRRTEVAAAALSRWPKPRGGDPFAMARLVNGVAAALPLPANCVARSVVLWSWLRRRGHRPEIWFGARPSVGGEQGAIEAHAWVVVDGQVVNDVADIAARYTPFPRPVTS
jgi:hypothetical protein